VSDGSLAALALRTRAHVDPRRFRMLLDLDACEPHEEDRWIGSRVRVGGAVLRVAGNVGRCVVTTQNPDTGEVDLDTLRAIRAYRDIEEERIPFGVYADVEESGVVRVGDSVEPLS